MSIVRPIGRESARIDLGLQIADIVRDAAKRGSVLNSSAEAAKLFAAFPKCGFTAAEITQQLTNEAAAMGVALEI
jgi:hypothetical protein